MPPLEHPHRSKRRRPWSLGRSIGGAVAPPPSTSPVAASTTTSSSSNVAAAVVPVRTPSALLARDPAQLAAALGTSLDRVKALRAEAAEGIICDEGVGHGGDAREVAVGVAAHCVRTGGVDADSDSVDGGDGRGGGGGGGGRLRPRMVRPRPLVPGSMTGLDLCARALLLESVSSLDGRPTGGIRTGSADVDRLLAPDAAHRSFGDGWCLPLPFDVPTLDGEVARRPSEDGGGVPFGMVTEFAGPPSSGKTQLALSVAAHAALENGMEVRYISGGNSRKALSRRLYAMCLELARRASSDRDPTSETKSLALRALERVTVASVPDAHSLLALLARIDDEETSCRRRVEDAVEGESDGTLLIVDSASGCLGHHLSVEKSGPALLNQVALTLRRMARTHDGHVWCGKGSPSPGRRRALRARRFAVVVTNGSVSKRPLDIETQRTAAGRGSQHKPAMGRYWQVSDVGLWFEEELSQNEGGVDRKDFFGNEKVSGLSIAETKAITATLQNHYGKSSKRKAGQDAKGIHLAKFRIRSMGVHDPCTN
ncbi:hypothetical protein ACHAWF_014867 [Thalassiosira exigua]